MCGDDADQQRTPAQTRGENFITATELADTFVREGGLPFRKAHKLPVRLSAACMPKARTRQILRRNSVRKSPKRCSVIRWISPMRQSERRWILFISSLFGTALADRPYLRHPECIGNVWLYCSRNNASWKKFAVDTVRPMKN